MTSIFFIFGFFFLPSFTLETFLFAFKPFLYIYNIGIRVNWGIFFGMSCDDLFTSTLIRYIYILYSFSFIVC